MGGGGEARLLSTTEYLNWNFNSAHGNPNKVEIKLPKDFSALFMSPVTKEKHVNICRR
jgi:hypothetical protein